jgi:hypothetical protein
MNIGRERWRRLLVGLVLTAVPLAVTSTAGAGHINKGEGHGSGPTVTIQEIRVNQQLVESVKVGCRFSIRFVVDGIKSPKEHTVVGHSAHLAIQDALGGSLTREQNGVVFLSGFGGLLAHADDDDTVDFVVELVDARGRVVATDAGTATSSCP